MDKNSKDKMSDHSNEKKPDAAPQKKQPNNPLHGVKLQDILEALVKEYGWKNLGQKIKIRCFNNDPSIKSSLKFLRRTQWARDEVEALYIKTFS